MKTHLFTLVMLAVSMGAFSQCYRGKGDRKLSIGMTFQDGGSGIQGIYDYGLGENMSIGASGTYVLNPYRDLDLRFEDKIDMRFRFNANLGNVINVDRNFDFYPGLNLGLRNFGGHIGARYFFSRGFGMYTETCFALARYKSGAEGRDLMNNQAMFVIGACFSF